MKIQRCEACRAAYDRLAAAHVINGQCRVLRREDVAHLSHWKWARSTALCEVAA